LPNFNITRCQTSKSVQLSIKVAEEKHVKKCSKTTSLVTIQVSSWRDTSAPAALRKVGVLRVVQPVAAQPAALQPNTLRDTGMEDTRKEERLSLLYLSKPPIL